jgi:sugar lactone lactonase YvrE
MRTNNLAETQRMLELAATAWPAQPSYSVSVASVAALRGDATTLAAALVRLAKLEAGGELLDDTTIVRIALTDKDVENARLALQRALTTVGESRVHHQLVDSTDFPEGVAIDARTGSMYVTSIRHRTIIERTKDGKERDVLKRSLPNVGAMLAVRVDPDGKHLWATTAAHAAMTGYSPADSTIAALLHIRIADGQIIRRWDLGDNGQHIPGDVALAPDGDVFVSDSRSPLLYRLRRSTGKMETLMHPYFRSLQGLALTPDGRALYVADYSHGLLRVDLENGAVQRLEHHDSFTTVGLDGIALHGSSIVAVQNGMWPARIVQYQLDSSGLRVTSARTIDRQTRMADEPTNGVIVGNDFIYIANSQWEKYDAKGQRILSQPLTVPRLLILSLLP